MFDNVKTTVQHVTQSLMKACLFQVTLTTVENVKKIISSILEAWWKNPLDFKVVYFLDEAAMAKAKRILAGQKVCSKII